MTWSAYTDYLDSLLSWPLRMTPLKEASSECATSLKVNSAKESIFKLRFDKSSDSILMIKVLHWSLKKT